jgi:hypothetical protein
MKKILSLAFLVIFCVLNATSQQLMSITPKKPIVCYLEPKNKNTSFGPPAAFLKARANPNARTATANIEVEYVGFDSQAKAAFQYAVDIWETLIESPVKIKIRAFWRPLGANVLGSATWATAFTNFPNAQKLNVFYPVALAEKIAGKDLNHPDSVDIIASFSSETAWYYSTSGTPPSNTTDLVSVVLHEIGHGLGFVDSFDVENSIGQVGLVSTVPIIYDLAIENNTLQNLFQTFDSPSANLGSQLIGNNLFYNSPLATSQSGNVKPKVYAPATWSAGSSIAHLDENTYPSGDQNSLMSPQIGFREVMHNPGPITLNMFSDMGWVTTRMEHTPTNKEAIEATALTATLSSDNGYDASKVKLKYIKKSGGPETEVVGVATGTANEFSFSIPASTVADTVFYFITSTDNLGREFTNPGKFARLKATEIQGRYTMGIGPDTKAPIITHTPKAFITATTTSIKLDAIVVDNIGIQGVFVDYSINNISQTAIAMSQTGTTSYSSSSLVATVSSSYTATINFTVGQLTDGDVITYSIRAKDTSLAQNSGYSPTATTTHSVNVVGLAATQDTYQNNFDNLSSTDFFGDTQFTISKPNGFANGAIHSVHPYPEAGSGPDLNFIYQLRIPIKVKAQDATVKFDEIVLVEPGKDGKDFGDPEFFDYVVVEGSKNGGVTWTPLANGYDARDDAAWLSKYNSSVVNNISQGIGDPTLFKSRTLSLLNKFKANDEVVIRFRLFCDSGAAGWGWAIDNLKIQIDETPPTVLHDHLNFTTDKSQPLVIAMKATDGSGLKSLAVEYKVNNGSVTPFNIPVSANVSDYTFNLDIAAASIGDDVQYRIRAIDNLNNEVVLPSTDFFHVPIITLSAPVNQYTSDFNSSNADFIGNFFSISTPSGFSSGAIHSSHPYPNGFGLTNSNSAFTLTLTKPLIISSSNPNMVFDEIGIIEPINDYAVVEGSKDNGITWKPFLIDYGATNQSSWNIAYNTKASGTPSLFKNRFINLTQNGNFKSGDQVLIRFKLNVNGNVNAWGWAIDNLSIQGLITGFEKTITSESLSIYPSPSKGEEINIQFSTQSDAPVSLHIINAQGQTIQTNEIIPVSNFVRYQYQASEWVNGMYFLKIDVGGSTVTRKLIKSE